MRAIIISCMSDCWKFSKCSRSATNDYFLLSVNLPNIFLINGLIVAFMKSKENEFTIIADKVKLQIFTF